MRSNTIVLRFTGAGFGTSLAGAAGHSAATGSGHPLILSLAAAISLAVSLAPFRGVSVWCYLGVCVGGALAWATGWLSEPHATAVYFLAAVVGLLFSVSLVPDAWRGIVHRRHDDASNR